MVENKQRNKNIFYVFAIFILSIVVFSVLINPYTDVTHPLNTVYYHVLRNALCNTAIVNV
mgnify:CR=1 FL=1